MHLSRYRPITFLAPLLLALWLLFGVASCDEMANPENPVVHWGCANGAQARVAAMFRAGEMERGGYFIVSDTGSMKPLIHGGDYIAVDFSYPYSSLRAGQVVLYRANWRPVGSLPVSHRTAQKDGLGWIMSGDNNRYYENRWRMTEDNYLGLVTDIYTTRAQP